MAGIRVSKVRSKEPYYLEEAEIGVYSIEELAYYLYNNIYFYDKRIFRESLFSFMEQEWKRETLAKKLRYVSKTKNDLDDYVLLVLEDSEYYSEQELKNFVRTMKSISKKPPRERSRLRAQALYEKGKLTSAYEEYQNILAVKSKKHVAFLTGNEEEDRFYAQIYYGVGRIKARLFFFQEAAKDFKKAYILHKDEEYAKALIRSILLQEPERQWDSEGMRIRIREQCENLMVPDELIANTIANAKEIYLAGEMTDTYDRLEATLEYKGGREIDLYRNDLYQIVEGWKNEYRNNTR